MTTNQYCESLLEEVRRAGRDPDLAYLVRTRLRRALVALERGRRGEDANGPAAEAPAEIRSLVKSLASRASALCQPSEALDVRWKRDWSSVFQDVERLRVWLASNDVRA